MTTEISLPVSDSDAEALAIERALQAAVRQTLIDHKRSGDPVVFCDDGQIRWVPAEEIEIPEPSPDSAS